MLTNSSTNLCLQNKLIQIFFKMKIMTLDQKKKKKKKKKPHHKRKAHVTRLVCLYIYIYIND